MLSRLNAIRLSILSVVPGLVRQANYIPANRPMTTSSGEKELATFASGCFWGTEHIFLKKFPPAESKGILSTRVGYTGGNEDAADPSYRDVCSGATGHAEAVRIEYDPSTLKYEDLVEYFYRTHDPTTVNKQGPDTGTQYRSAIFYHTPEQKSIAEQVTADIQQKYFDSKGQKIVTSIEPAGRWYDAEDYHQEYLFKNPFGYQCPTHREQW